MYARCTAATFSGSSSRTWADQSGPSMRAPRYSSSEARPPSMTWIPRRSSSRASALTAMRKCYRRRYESESAYLVSDLHLPAERAGRTCLLEQHSPSCGDEGRQIEPYPVPLISGISLTRCLHSRQNPHSNHHNRTHNNPMRWHMNQACSIGQSGNHDCEPDSIKSKRHEISFAGYCAGFKSGLADQTREPETHKSLAVLAARALLSGGSSSLGLDAFSPGSESCR